MRETKKRTLTPSEARELSENATHTRFTWAVIFLACITALIELLPQITNVKGSSSALTILLGTLYFLLDAGLTLSLYKLLFTTYLLEIWSRCLKPRIAQEVREKWKTIFPSILCFKEEDGQVLFTRYRAYSVCGFLFMLLISIMTLKILA